MWKAGKWEEKGIYFPFRIPDFLISIFKVVRIYLGYLRDITLEFGGELLQLIGAFSPALVKSHLLVHLAVGHGPVPHERGVFGFAAARVFEGEKTVMNGFSEGCQAIV